MTISEIAKESQTYSLIILGIVGFLLLFFGYRLRRVVAVVMGFALGVLIGWAIWIAVSWSSLAAALGLQGLANSVASAKSLQEAISVINSYFESGSLADRLKLYGDNVEYSVLLTWVIPAVLGVLVSIVAGKCYKGFYAASAAISAFFAMAAPFSLYFAGMQGSSAVYIISLALFAACIGVAVYMIVDISVILTTSIAGDFMLCILLYALKMFKDESYPLLITAALLFIGMIAQLAAMRGHERREIMRRVSSYR